MTAQEIQQQLEQEIPMSTSLGYKLQEIRDSEAIAYLPLDPNINHKGTFFGGSQYSGCALTCYALFLFAVRDLGHLSNNIVVSQADIKYLKPAPTGITIRSFWDSDEARIHFLEQVRRHKKGRVGLGAHVMDHHGLILSEFRGSFVVFI